MPGPNRRQKIEIGDTEAPVVGIDYLVIDDTQTVLTVHFIGSARDVLNPSDGGAFAGEARIASLSGAATQPTVEVVSAIWQVPAGTAPALLVISTAAPGDFTRYALTLIDGASPTRIDPYFNDLPFRFQAGCRSDLDCALVEAPCPATTEPDVDIDYTARDFDSFRRALLDFVSQRWPSYGDRLEADVGVMLMEAMSALADEMAYYQDRVAREASFATATQRRSMRQHARLLDYELHDGLAAWTWLRIMVAPTEEEVVVAAGTQVFTARTDAGGNSLGQPIVFEIGRGLVDTHPESGPAASYTARRVWNEIAAWQWDEDETCLPIGSTSVHVRGPWIGVADTLWPVPAGPATAKPDRWVLLQTAPQDRAIPPRAHVVKLTNAVEIFDPVANETVTRLDWDESDATREPLELESLRVHANLVPAVAGRTLTAQRVIERVGPNGTRAVLIPLPETERELLCFVGEAPEAARPEVRVDTLTNPLDLTPTPWTWRRALVGSPSALPTEEAFTLDDGVFGEVVRYHRGKPEPISHFDYKSGGGFTVRFGDGSIGAVPDPGLLFLVRYRVGGGACGNLAADTLVETDLAGIAVTNPLAIRSGVDPESLAEVRKLAPEAWRERVYRAVRPSDYAEQLSRLDWVDRAGASLRWTGSWPTLFGTPDPRDAVALSAERRGDAERQLDRVRQAGRQTHVCDPVHGWLDLRIEVCVEPTSFRGDVQARLIEALFGKAGAQGFFDPDNFSFGDALRRSALCAALQRVAGVRAIERIYVRRRGHFDWRPFEEEALAMGVREVLGVANDPLFPERGSVSFVMEGGA